MTITWDESKNKRRSDLIDKEIEGSLSPTEKDELPELQNQMLAFRRELAPLPMKATGAVLLKAAQRAMEDGVEDGV